MEYWEEHPPLHLLVQGIAGGMSGRVVGKQIAAAPQPQPKHIESAEELMGIIGGAGIPIGVVRQPGALEVYSGR
jgi:hypothetical protein